MRNVTICLIVLFAMLTMISCTQKNIAVKKDKSEIEFEEKIKSLIKEGADLNQKDKSGIPLLVWAAVSGLGYVDSVDLLLSHGANPNVKVDADGSTALHRIISSEDLVESKKINQQIAQQQKKNEQKIIKLLLEHGALVDLKNRWEETPLYVAAGDGRKDLSQILIEGGAELNVRRVDGSSPLHCAAKDGYWKVVELLLENGADVNTENDFGNTPLSLALKKERQDQHTKSRKLDSSFFKNADYDKTIGILEKYGAKK